MHEAVGSGMWGMEFDENGVMTSVEWSPEFRKMIGFTDENDFPNKLEPWSERLHPIGRLLRRDDGVPLSYVGMFVDITDRKNGQSM